MAKKIQVDEIIDGMVLKSPVVNQYGQVLLGINTELKESHKRMLKMWGIAYVSIESEDEPEDFTFSEEILDLALEELSSRLSWEPRNKPEEDLLQLGLIATAKRIEREGK